MRKLLASLVILSFMAVPVMAEQFKGEFNDMCTMGLANHKEVKTDCSVNEKWQGKTYCFGNADAMKQFDQDRAGNLAKAEKYYKSLNK